MTEPTPHAATTHAATPAGQPPPAPTTPDAPPPAPTVDPKEFVALTKRRQDIAKREAALAETAAKHEATARELADLAEFAKTFEANPVEAWERLAKRSGKDPDELYETLSKWKLNRGKAPTDDRVSKLEAQIEADKRAAAEREAQAAEAAADANRRAVCAELAGSVKTSADKFEALAAGFTEAEIADAIYFTCAEKRRVKASFTTESVLRELEANARAHRDRWKPSQPATSSGATKTTEVGKAANGAAPRTIAASDAALKTGARRQYQGAAAHRAEVLRRLT